MIGDLEFSGLVLLTRKGKRIGLEENRFAFGYVELNEPKVDKETQIYYWYFHKECLTYSPNFLKFMI